jgi:predicted RecA/RadA family phage recombinase
MATIDWPTGDHYLPRELQFGISTPKSAAQAPFTGQVQTVGHLADRLRCTITLPACNPADGQRREAFFITLSSTGDWVRLRHLQRLAPLGSMRGLPTVTSTTTAGARTLAVTATPGATVEPGDVVSVAGQMIMVAHPGATADGSGNLAMPLALPLITGVSAGAAVVWSQPTGVWQMAGVQGIDVRYGRARWQAAFDVNLLQVA